MRQSAAIVVAAGSGERLGLGVPKGFVLLAGEPLLVHAVRVMHALGPAVVVVGEGDVARAEAVLTAAGLSAHAVVAGGATRQESVARGLARVPEDAVVVAVHDAARPLVTPALLERTLAALEDGWDAVAPALPIVDTLKELAGEEVVTTVDRSRLWAVQTPQVFRDDALVRAHAWYDVRGATDDLALVERAGGRVRLVKGERCNFKITFADDLALAELLLAAERRP